MIQYIEGDIFRSPAQVIVNAVNTIGVMGKGIALSFKQRYPDMFEKYQNFCEHHQFHIGQLMLYYGQDYWVLLFPTKEHWRNPSRIEYIELGLQKFISTYEEKQITSVAFPRLGCGNGGLHWEDVQPVMERYLGDLPIPVYVYMGLKQKAEPEHKTQKMVMEWLRKHAKDMSFNGLKDDIQHQSCIVPYVFSMGDDAWDVVWDQGVRFKRTHSADDIECLSESALFDLWDGIREKGVFLTAKAPRTAQLTYKLLEDLGYLSPVGVYTAGRLEMVQGYQLDGGAERTFALSGRLSS